MVAAEGVYETTFVSNEKKYRVRSFLFGIFLCHKDIRFDHVYASYVFYITKLFVFEKEKKIMTNGETFMGTVREGKNIGHTGNYYMIVAVNSGSYDVMYLDGEFGHMSSTDVENDESANMTMQEFLETTMILARGGNYAEYGENAELSFDNFICSFGDLYSKEEYLEDSRLTESEFDKDSYVMSLIARVEEETTVLRLPNGNYIVFWGLDD